MAAAFGLASCSGFPTPPEGLPADWVPSATPSAIPSGQADSPLGFTPEERTAVRVRAENCEFLVTGSGFVVDDHTVVTNSDIVDGYVNVEASLADGTDLTVTVVASSVGGDFTLLTIKEDLAPHVTFAETDPEEGDDLVAVGYPSFEAISTGYGKKEGETSRHEDPSNIAYYASFWSFGGEGGAPVFNEDGLLVGMFDEPYESEELSAYFPASALRALLDDPSLVTDVARTTCE
jgi:hypothetical protein